MGQGLLYIKHKRLFAFKWCKVDMRLTRGSLNLPFEKEHSNIKKKKPSSALHYVYILKSLSLIGSLFVCPYLSDAFAFHLYLTHNLSIIQFS